MEQAYGISRMVRLAFARMIVCGTTGAIVFGGSTFVWLKSAGVIDASQCPFAGAPVMLVCLCAAWFGLVIGGSVGMVSIVVVGKTHRRR